MSVQFIVVKKAVSGIEDYAEDKSTGFEISDRVAGYGSVDGEGLSHDKESEKLVTIILTPNRSITCVIDVAAIDLEEGKKVQVIMVGNNLACIINPENKKYVYFAQALHNKYNRPRMVSGINTAIISVIAGYILYLIMQKVQSDMAAWTVAGGALLLFLGSLLYTSHVSVDTKHGHNKLRQYLKKLLH